MKLFFNSEIILQVDVLRATALPLLKQFGIDGESFELKVRMCELLAVYICVKHYLTNSLEELYDVCIHVCVPFEVTIYKKTHRTHESKITDF